MSTKRDFLILYGSQTGQAQAISEEIFDRATQKGFNCLRFCLSQTEKKFSIEKETCVVFVCSTTGEGDPPDTAAKFLRRLKKKTLPNNYLQYLHYAFLALGDSNYTNFCNCGKLIDARLKALGAKHFYDTGYADDAVGLELIVEPWIDDLFPAVKKHLGLNLNIDNSELVQLNSGSNNGSDNEIKIKNKSANDSSLTTKNSATTGQVNPDQGKNKKTNIIKGNIENNQSTEPPDDLNQSRDSSDATIATNINKMDKVTDKNGTRNSDIQLEEISNMTESLLNSIPPLSTIALKIPTKSDGYLELMFIGEENTGSHKRKLFEHPSAATRVHTVAIRSARQLTNDPLVKKTLEIELDITDIDFDFQPGDSFGIVCKNKEDEVNYLIERLDLTDVADKLLTLQIKLDTKKKAPTVPEHIFLPNTLRGILTENVDYRAVPRKAFIRMLVDYTDDAGEKRRLQELCSTQGGKHYTTHIREKNIGLVEILQTFNSCKPPIERVLEFLPRLLPREYSIASSPLKSKNYIRFVFNVIELPSFRDKQRYGLCTKYLDDLTVYMRRNETKLDNITDRLENLTILPPESENPKINIYFRKPTNFRFPEDSTLPLIMIGPGTGIAPFIGFLEQRECLKNKDVNLKLGKSLLFYGCRYKERDFLYRSKINVFQDKKILGEILCSHSREDSASNHTKYVQENIIMHKDVVMRLVIQERGSVFICGDAKHMGRDVTNTFVKLLEEYKGLSKIDAIKFLDELRGNKQFLEDVWT